MKLEPKIVQAISWLVVGLSFYGDPFDKASGWSEENEIGLLWQRLMRLLAKSPNAITQIKEPDTFLEIHIQTDETEEKGIFEIFVGAVVHEIEDVPLSCLVKKLPATTYAVFTLEGKAITADWERSVFSKWMPASGYESAQPYSIQYYDHRFKGMDSIEESILDVYVPVKLKAE